MTRRYLRLELLRVLRDPRYLALALGGPIGFYLLFATLFGGQATTAGQTATGDQATTPIASGRLPPTVEIMVAMAAYGAMWAVISATGPRIAQERENGWFGQLRAMPIRAYQVLIAKVTASMALALPALVLVCATAAIVKGVRLGAGQWLAMLGVMWVGSLPFAAIGLAIGYGIAADSSFALSYGIYMAMAAVGGLYVPPSVMPAGMRTAAEALPSYQLADLGWRIAGGGVPRLGGVAVLLAWTIGASALAVLGYRRPRLRRAMLGKAQVTA